MAGERASKERVARRSMRSDPHLLLLLQSSLDDLLLLLLLLRGREVFAREGRRGMGVDAARVRRGSWQARGSLVEQEESKEARRQRIPPSLSFHPPSHSHASSLQSLPAAAPLRTA
jgi:hypothetical protein